MIAGPWASSTRSCTGPDTSGSPSSGRGGRRSPGRPAAWRRRPRPRPASRSNHRNAHPKSSVRLPAPLRRLASTAEPTSPIHSPTWLRACPARFSSSSPVTPSQMPARTLDSTRPTAKPTRKSPRPHRAGRAAPGRRGCVGDSPERQRGGAAPTRRRPGRRRPAERPEERPEERRQPAGRRPRSGGRRSGVGASGPSSEPTAGSSRDRGVPVRLGRLGAEVVGTGGDRRRRALGPPGGRPAVVAGPALGGGSRSAWGAQRSMEKGSLAAQVVEPHRAGRVLEA